MKNLGEKKKKKSERFGKALDIGININSNAFFRQENKKHI